MEKAWAFHVGRSKQLLVTTDETIFLKIVLQDCIIVDRVERQEGIGGPAHDGSGEMNGIEKKGLTLFLFGKRLDQYYIDPFWVNVLKCRAPSHHTVRMTDVSNVGPDKPIGLEWVGVDDLLDKIQLGIPDDVAFLGAYLFLRIHRRLFFQEGRIVLIESEIGKFTDHETRSFLRGKEPFEKRHHAGRGKDDEGTVVGCLGKVRHKILDPFLVLRVRVLGLEPVVTGNDGNSGHVLLDDQGIVNIDSKIFTFLNLTKNDVA